MASRIAAPQLFSRSSASARRARSSAVSRMSVALVRWLRASSSSPALCSAIAAWYSSFQDRSCWISMASRNACAASLFLLSFSISSPCRNAWPASSRRVVVPSSPGALAPAWSGLSAGALGLGTGAGVGGWVGAGGVAVGIGVLVGGVRVGSAVPLSWNSGAGAVFVHASIAMVMMKMSGIFHMRCLRFFLVSIARGPALAFCLAFRSCSSGLPPRHGPGSRAGAGSVSQKRVPAAFPIIGSARAGLIQGGGKNGCFWSGSSLQAPRGG